MGEKISKKYLKKIKKEVRREMEAKQDGKEVKKQEEREAYLKSETKNGILIVVFVVLFAILTLSIIGWAGTVGEGIDTTLERLFGWAKYVVPLIFLIIAYLFLKPQKYILRTINYIGFFLFVLSLTAILHLKFPLDKAIGVIAEGRGGGYFGLILSYPLKKFLDIWASSILLFALLLISLLITFDISLRRLYERGNIFKRLTEKFREFYYKLKVNLEGNKQEKVPPEEKEASFEVKEIPEQPKTEEINLPERKQVFKEQLEIFPKFKKAKRKIEIPLDLLESDHKKPTSGDITANKVRIQNTLRNFGIEVEMGDVKVGPTVTQYSLRPADGVKLSQITTLHNDLALALASHPIRIEAPIPGMSLVGIEVPNQSVAIVKLKDILASDDFKNRKSNLTIALGKDVAGKCWVADLDPMPHLLIAGATGSGKTVCLNSVIVSLLYQNSPDELKIILVDPKRVEMPAYNGVPHLLTPVVTDVNKTINVLHWIVGEMDRRFEFLSRTGKRNIQSYNQSNPDEPLPYIILIIDELADLIAVAVNEVEAAIIRLAQMARAVGIHLIVATQRPSVDVITGLIKANITARIAFSVASLVDSRTILDTSGAEKLLGRGDMLFISANLSQPKRLQGAYLNDKEIERVVSFLKSKAQPEYNEGISEKQIGPKAVYMGEELKDDELLPEAKELILQTGKASASFLQRRMRIGYARAARLLDLLEEQGIIGPADGAKPREILVEHGQMESVNTAEEPTEEENDEMG